MEIGRVAVTALVLAMVLGACSGSGSGSDAGTTSTAAPAPQEGPVVDMTPACEQLRVVADEILTLQAEPSDAQWTVVGEAVDQFAVEAKASNDDELAEQARRIQAGFHAYVEGTGPSAPVDAAIDQAGKRCIDTGTVDTLPTQPG